jgi:hypothetical protein
MSKDDLRKLEMKLPAYARAQLRHLRSAADQAEAESNVRWRRQQADIEKRNTLKLAVTNAEAEYRAAHHRLSVSDWREQESYYLEAVNAARAELKAHNDGVEERSVKAKQANRDESGLLEKCELFLAQNQRAKFIERRVEIPPDGAKKALAQVRSDIIERRAAINDIDNAPLTVSEAMAAIDAELEKVAAAGKPDTFPVTRHVEELRGRRQGNLRWRTAYVAGELLPNGHSLVVWLFKDQIRERLREDVERRIASSAFEPIALADREPRKDALCAEILNLERLEEACVYALQAEGDANVIRRHDADIRAVLGIEVLPPGKEIQQKSSAMMYEPPKMETPAGQSLPRSSQWMENGRDTIANAKK